MKLKIFISQVDSHTQNGVWIKIPDSNKKFWLSGKCYYPNDYWATIYLNENYTYHCKSGSRGKNRYDVLGSKLIDIFSKGDVKLTENKKVEPITNKPEKLTVRNVDVEEELMR